MVFTNEGFLDVVIESRPDWNLSSYYAITGCVADFLSCNCVWVH